MSLKLAKHLIVALTSLLLIPFNSFAQNKHALIIGNNNYSGIYGKLTTCINDADEMNKCLTALGYETIILKDATRQEISDAFKRFNTLLSNGTSVGVFYYSGHATQIGSDYCLVPAKTQIELSSLKNDCIDISQIESYLRKKCRYSFLFFDACRDYQAQDDLYKGNSGFAPRDESLYKSSRNVQMHCFATRMGDVARVGSGKLSPFTEILTRYLFHRGSFIDLWNNKIKPDVYSIAKQIPDGQHDFSKDDYDFCFNKSGVSNPYRKTMTINVSPASKIKIGNQVIDSGKEFQLEYGYSYTYTINHAGYKPYEGTINVDASTLSKIDIKLQKESAQKEITINVTPASEIKFGNQVYNSGGALLFEYGSTYTYTIEHDGYKPYTGTIQVDASTPSTIDIKLVKIQEAKLRVICNKPKSAKVYLDGTYMGWSPITITTTDGVHNINVTANKYISKSKKINLTPGNNKPYILSLDRRIPEWFDYDDWGAHLVSYHFSPKYQIGLSYMYRIDITRFSVGLMLSSSTGFYRGWGLRENVYTYSSGATVQITQVDDGSGNMVDATIRTSTIYDGMNDKYSTEIDPYNEARPHDSNFLFLANMGFNACNGFMLEAGFGGACHRVKYYMPNSYSITKTTTTNNLTGEQIGEPEYKYQSTGNDHWYKGSQTWSPAARLGARFFIPLGGFDYSITIGGGYTYLPMNHEFSSWDASIGFCWEF